MPFELTVPLIRLDLSLYIRSASRVFLPVDMSMGCLLLGWGINPSIAFLCFPPFVQPAPENMCSSRMVLRKHRFESWGQSSSEARVGYVPNDNEWIDEPLRSPPERQRYKLRGFHVSRVLGRVVTSVALLQSDIVPVRLSSSLRSSSS